MRKSSSKMGGDKPTWTDRHVYGSPFSRHPPSYKARTIKVENPEERNFTLERRKVVCGKNRYCLCKELIIAFFAYRIIHTLQVKANNIQWGRASCLDGVNNSLSEVPFIEWTKEKIPQSPLPKRLHKVQCTGNHFPFSAAEPSSSSYSIFGQFLFVSLLYGKLFVPKNLHSSKFGFFSHFKQRNFDLPVIPKAPIFLLFGVRRNWRNSFKSFYESRRPRSLSLTPI